MWKNLHTFALIQAVDVNESQARSMCINSIVVCVVVFF